MMNFEEKEKLKVKFIIVSLMALILWMPLNADARGEQTPWQILDEALTYLHSVPEVAWVKFNGHNVMIGWKDHPRKFGKINRTAARNAAHALHNEVTVYSLRAEETSIKEGDEESYLCKTIANPQEILQSSCR
jgi:hypothetical protein